MFIAHRALVQFKYLCYALYTIGQMAAWNCHVIGLITVTAHAGGYNVYGSGAV